MKIHGRDYEDIQRVDCTYMNSRRTSVPVFIKKPLPFIIFVCPYRSASCNL